MGKKSADGEGILFKDEHLVGVGDTIAIERLLHQDSLTYRVMSVRKRKDGYSEARLELLIDRSKGATKELAGASAPASDEIQKLIQEFEREFLGL